MKVRHNQPAEAGVTLLETVVVIAIVAIGLALATVGVRGYRGAPTLAGWSDVIVNDIRSAQQMGIARRATASFTIITSKTYVVSVAGTIVRRDTLPDNLDISPASLQFSSLGVPGFSSDATLTLSDSTSGNTVTITVNKLTGAVTTQ